MPWRFLGETFRLGLLTEDLEQLIVDFLSTATFLLRPGGGPPWVGNGGVLGSKFPVVPCVIGDKPVNPICKGLYSH